MNKLFKMGLALVCALFALSTSLNAQTFTLTTNNTGGTVYKVTGSSLTAIPTGGTFNPGDIITMLWVSNATTTASTTGDVIITATPSGAGPVSVSWTTKGDIGVASGGGATLSAGLNTINKGNRSPGSLFDFGQSKGRVIYTWSTTPNTCGNQQMYFDVYKAFSGTNLNGIPVAVTPPTPPIIGPSCIKPNTTYTYSVDPIVSDNLTDQIGLDRYFWDISAVTGGVTNIYYSTDSSSITFTTGGTVPATATIQCNIGVANTAPWGANTAYATKVLQQGVVAPTVTITGGATPSSLSTYPATTCVLTNAGGAFNTAMTFTAGPTTNSYTWASSTGLADAGTTPVVSGVSNSVYSITVSNNPGTITVTSTSSCGDQRVDVITVNRGFVASATGNFPTAPTCVTPGLQSNAFITLSNASLLYTQLIWAGTAGSVAVSGGTSTNFNFTAGAYPLVATTSGGTGAVTVSGPVGCGSTLSYPVSIRPASLTFSPLPCISRGASGAGPIVCTNNALITGCSYAWNIPGASGITAVSPTALSSTVNATSTATSAINFVPVYTVGVPSCSTLASPQTININPIAATGLAGSSCYNIGFSTSNAGSLVVSGYPGFGSYIFTQTSTVSTGPWLFTGVVTGGGASWTNTYSPAAPTSTVGTTATFQFPNTNTTVNSSANPYCAGLTPGTYNITIVHTVPGSSCANSAAFGPTAITATRYGTNFLEIPTAGSDDLFKAIGLPTGYTANWWRGCPGARLAIPGTASVATNPTFTTCDLFTTAGSGTVYSVDIALSGCTTTYSLPTTIYNAKTNNNNGGGSPINFKHKIHIFPNPNSGKFGVQVDNTFENGNMYLYNASGQKVVEKTLKQGANDFDVKLPTGVYQVHVVVDGEEQTQKMVITD